MWPKWTQQEAFKHLAPAPYMQPIVSLLHRRPQGQSQWSAHHANAARQVVAGGAVTQVVLHQWGWGANPACKACGQAVGTAAHRFHLYPARQHARWAMASQTWQHVAEVVCAEGGPATLWTRDLAATSAAS